MQRVMSTFGLLVASFVLLFLSLILMPSATADDITQVSATSATMIERDLIHNTITNHLDEVKLCYDFGHHHHNGRRPVANGRIHMAWQIVSGGGVRQVAVLESTLHNRLVEGCLTQRIRQWQFPKMAAGQSVRVDYPFLFVANSY